MWQCAMNGFEPHRRVVAPIGTAVALPPGAADRVGAHAEPHAELEDARERAGRRHADHEALHDAEPRVRLHDAHEAQHRLGGHEAVGVERDGKFVQMPPALAEIADVAGLETGVDLAPPVGEGDQPIPRGAECGDLRRFVRRDLRVAGVAQHIEMEPIAHARRDEAAHQRLQVADHPLGHFVADADDDRGRDRDRLVPADAGGRRKHHGGRIARKAHDEEADAGVPEPDHRPRQRDGEQHQQGDIECAKAADRQRGRHEPQERGHHGGDQGEEQCLASGERSARRARATSTAGRSSRSSML